MNAEADMTKLITACVGLDVHKDSIAIAVAPGIDVAPWFVGTVACEVQLQKALRKVGAAGELYVVYEAGPCGYGLARRLRSAGYRCDVVAPGKIARGSNDRLKTDRRDALLLARLARSADLTVVRIPDECDEALRDLSRAREDAVAARLKARQQLQALLLRHGFRYTGKTAWTQKHQRYLATLSFAHSAQQLAFEEYRQAVQNADERVRRLTEALRTQVESWRMKSVVHALMTLRGIDLIAAVTLIAELGDLSRFAHPREQMGFIGLVPSEHTSGATRRQGPITKTGNTHARRILVEAAWNYRFPARVSRDLQLRQEAQPQTIRDIAWKAQTRLCTRYRRLTARQLHHNKVCIAIARELAAFVWSIAQHAQPRA
jgi:transposase